MSKYAVVAVGVFMIATPALAAEFYVAQNSETKKCKLVEEKPDGKTMVMIGTGPYPTKEEAKAARKAATEYPKKKKKADQRPQSDEQPQSEQEEKPN